MKIRLSEQDAARLGCPRDLEFDFEQLSGRDMLELEEQLGWSFDTFQSALEGTPAVNALGGPIYEMNGDVPKLDPMGKPIRVMAISTKAIVVIVWMCARRANPAIRWESFDFNMTTIEIDNEEEPAGKAPAKARSRKSTTATSRRSRPSSA
jgi:hypothetical protein